MIYNFYTALYKRGRIIALTVSAELAVSINYAPKYCIISSSPKKSSKWNGLLSPPKSNDMLLSGDPKKE